MIDIRPRSQRTIRQERYDAVIIATGPAHSAIIRENPAIASLHDAGLIGLDAYGLGLAVDAEAVALDDAGSPVPGLYVAGPLARGSFGELMGLLEVTRHAEFVADRIVDRLID